MMMILLCRSSDSSSRRWMMEMDEGYGFFRRRRVTLKFRVDSKDTRGLDWDDLFDTGVWRGHDDEEDDLVVG
ncbi:hypothetical protein U1Q18_020525 [Sarracenia purpurea var. burkii]